MDSKRTISISEARKRIFEIAEEVQKPDHYYTLTENGKPKVVLMSVEDFESWKETLDVYREIPNLEDEIMKAKDEYGKGEYVTLEELMASEGFVLSDKGKKRYEVSSNNSKKSKKTDRKNRT